MRVQEQALVQSELELESQGARPVSLKFHITVRIDLNHGNKCCSSWV